MRKQTWMVICCLLTCWSTDEGSGVAVQANPGSKICWSRARRLTSQFLLLRGADPAILFRALKLDPTASLHERYWYWSSASVRGGAGTEARCHYDVLQVSQDAPQSEILASYRRLALQLHPDKNIHEPEEANEKFQELQYAYSVLTNPEERALYDRNREKILRNSNEDSSDEDINDGLHLWRYFASGAFSGYNDGERGFYTVFRRLFERIAEIEVQSAAGQDDPVKRVMRDAPSFGLAKTKYHDGVEHFYQFWSSFSSCRQFDMCHVYSIETAENRWVRRRMEEANRKEVSKARRHYNEKVHELVKFINRRDPRVIEHEKETIRMRSQTKRQEQKKLHERRLQRDELQASADVNNDPSPADREYEAQLQELLDAMLMEDSQSSLRSQGKKTHKNIPSHDSDGVSSDKAGGFFQHQENSTVEVEERGTKSDEGPTNTSSEISHPNISMGCRNDLLNLSEKVLPKSERTDEEDADLNQKPRVGMAKLKRMKKAMRGSHEEDRSRESESWRCVTCKAGFDSRNRLFEHIKKQKHASPLPHSKTQKFKGRKKG